MNKVTNILESFEPISLDEMNKVKLLDRLDKKFMFHASRLPIILEMAQKDYYILQIEGKKYAGYQTTYFDTPNFEMYTKHHNGKLNRYKVRFRTYVDSNLSFFEIKFKTNTGRTKKSRVMLSENDHTMHDEAEALLLKKSFYTADQLVPVLQVNYNRITLVNRNMTERITIDLGLNYASKYKKSDVNNLVIAEVKQDKSDGSAFIDIMQTLRIKTASLSKYCLGIAQTIDNVKTNNFKQKIKYVNQLFSKSA